MSWPYIKKITPNKIKLREINIFLRSFTMRFVNLCILATVSFESTQAFNAPPVIHNHHSLSHNIRNYDGPMFQASEIFSKQNANQVRISNENFKNDHEISECPSDGFPIVSQIDSLFQSFPPFFS